MAVSHRDTKHTDKWSNNKTETTQKQNEETRDIYLLYCENDTHTHTHTKRQSIRILYKVHQKNFCTY